MSGPRRGRQQRRGRDISGILLLDKPTGLSSNQALQAVKRLFQASKAGHTGNLDVQASGLLPICFGEATKVCQFLLDADKHYVSEYTFGRRTTTGDIEGAVVSERSVEGIDRARVESAMAKFVGMIDQIPPMHSAIKRGGQPLYKLAQQGIEVEREKRQVRIDRYTLLKCELPQVLVDIQCSKGTYVRTMAEDLGEVLGCGAHVSALRREGAGPYRLKDAFTLVELEQICAEGGLAALDALLSPADSALDLMPEVFLTEDATHYLENGQAVLVPRAPTSGLLRLYDVNGRFIGVGEILDDGRVAPRRLFRLSRAQSQGESIRRSA